VAAQAVGREDGKHVALEGDDLGSGWSGAEDDGQIQEQQEETWLVQQSENRCDECLRSPYPHPAFTTAVVLPTLSPQTGKGGVLSLAED